MPKDMRKGGGKYGAEERSKTSISSARNVGPGQGKFKAGIGDPLDLGLSSQKMMEGGSAAKLRGQTSEATQRPKAMKNTISADRGSFVYMDD